MIYQVRKSPESIGRAVDSLTYYRDYTATHDKERLLPDGKTNLVISIDRSEKYIFDNDSLSIKQTCRDAWFAGLQTELLTISSGINAEMLIVSFSPVGAWSLLKKSMKDFTNRVIQAEQVLDDCGFTLLDELRVCSSPNEMFDATGVWLESSMIELSENQSKVLEVTEKIASQPYGFLIADAVELSGLSQRHLIQLFREYVGVTPKQFQKLVRFNRILDQIHNEKNVDFGAAAAECGYYDQAHFIRDFKAFSGVNPTSYIATQGQWQNYLPVR